MRDPSDANRPLLVIVNPTAGRGRALARGDQLARELGRVGIRHELVRTATAGDAERFARDSEGAVVAVGGDGTVHEVLNGLPQRGGLLGPLAVLPSGSGDDFAASAGFAASPRELAQRLLLDDHRACDFGEATITCAHGTVTRRFANEASIGFVADVARAARALPVRGRCRYLIATLRALLRLQPLAASITKEDEPADGADLLFASFCNGSRVGGGLPLAPGARLDDGRIDLLTVDATSRIGTLRLLGRLLRRRHLDDPRVRIVQIRRASVRATEPASVAMDGDVVAEAASELAVRASSVLRLAGAV